MHDPARRFEARIRAIAAPLIDAAFDSLVERLLGKPPAPVAAPRRAPRARVARPAPTPPPPQPQVAETPQPAFEPIIRKPGRSGQPSRDPLTMARIEHGPCMVYRCPQPHEADGYCAAHRAQAAEEGWPVPAPRSFRPPGVSYTRLKPPRSPV